MSIPLVDLRAQYCAIKNEIDQVVAEIFEEQRFIGGHHVTSLEQEIAAYANVNYAVGVASGTDALLLTFRAAGIGPGDEVITSPFTFFATAGAIVNVGAKPVFVDIDPRSFNINTDLLEQAVTPRTRAIVPVHLFGQCADMDGVWQVARKYNLMVIEDAAQSLGATFHGQCAGTLGDAAAVSFFPSKNLGGAGDGGMVLTNDADLAEKVRLLRNHGQDTSYKHVFVGTNSRLDALQAGVLRVKLKYLPQWTEQRRSHAAYYTQHFQDIEQIKCPEEQEGAYHVYNQYTIRVPRRDDALARLRQREIGCAVYYPIPLHLQPCFRELGYRKGDFPEAEKASLEVLSIPVYPELQRHQQDEIIENIQQHLTDVT